MKIFSRNQSELNIHEDWLEKVAGFLLHCSWETGLKSSYINAAISPKTGQKRVSSKTGSS
jgi:hypothetical protein